MKHKHPVRLLLALAPAAALFLTGCATGLTTNLAKGRFSDKTYQTRAVASAEILPNGDLQLLASGFKKDGAAADFVILVPKSELEARRKILIGNPQAASGDLHAKFAPAPQAGGSPVPVRVVGAGVKFSEFSAGAGADPGPAIILRPAREKQKPPRRTPRSAPDGGQPPHIYYIEPAPRDGGMFIGSITVTRKPAPAAYVLLPFAAAWDIALGVATSPIIATGAVIMIATR